MYSFYPGQTRSRYDIFLEGRTIDMIDIDKQLIRSFWSHQQNYIHIYIIEKYNFENRLDS